MRISIIIRKMLGFVPMIFLISLLCFTMVYFSPGDSSKRLLETKSGRDLFSAEDIANFSDRVGIKTDIIRAYMNWTNNLIKGDMGYSILYSEPVYDVVCRHAANTISLVLIAFICYITTGVFLGFSSGLSPGGTIDRISRLWATISLSLPEFWIAGLVVYTVSKFIPALPVLYFSGPISFILPGVLMGLLYAGNLAVLLRDRVIRIGQEEFISCAQAMGISRANILWKHILPNALPTIVSVSAIGLSSMLMGSLLIEKIFSIPGLGQLFLKAVYIKDYSLMAACTLFFCLAVCICNLVAEIIYPIIDRRLLWPKKKG